MGQWFYARDDRVFGPLTSAEIKAHVARGALRAHDRLWAAGSDPAHGVEARAALDFSRPTPPSPALPDWLQDVADQEVRGPVAGLPENHDAPDWLEDLKLWYELEAPAAPVPQAVPVLPIAAALAPPGPEPAPPLARPIPPQTVAPTAVPRAVPLASPVAPRAAPAVAESGFDPQTGQIHDPAKFRAWQKAQAATPVAAPVSGNLMEVFRAARTAIERWVDAPGHRELIIRGDLAAVGRDPELVAVFEKYAGHSPVMQEKLFRHLALLVDNRRKFYKARPND